MHNQIDNTTDNKDKTNVPIDVCVCRLIKDPLILVFCLGTHKAMALHGICYGGNGKEHKYRGKTGVFRY